MVQVSNIVSKLRGDLQEFIPGSRVILFGSRAKGDFEAGNDIDLLVISPKDVTPNERMDLEADINRVLVGKYMLPFDILVYSESEVELKKNEKSLVLYHALKNGIELS